MSRIVPIRIAENDRKEYARLVKNSKSKIKRTSKNYGIDLSDVVELKPLEGFSNRKEFNEWKQSVSSFTNRNNLTFQFQKNDYGVVASKKEINKIVRDTKKAQRNADKVNKELMSKPYYLASGEQQGTVGEHQRMMANQTIGINRPLDFNFNNVRNQKRLETVKENMKRQSDPKSFSKKMTRMQDNYIKLLEISLNSNADELIEKIRLLPPDEFYDMYGQNNKVFDFDLWDSEGQFLGADEESRGIVGKMMTVVDEYFSRNKDLDLKDFPNS